MNAIVSNKCFEIGLKGCFMPWDRQSIFISARKSFDDHLKFFEMSYLNEYYKQRDQVSLELGLFIYSIERF